MTTRSQYETRLSRLQARASVLETRLNQILSGEDVTSYSTGAYSVTHTNLGMNSKALEDELNALYAQIEDIENILAGRRTRESSHVVYYMPERLR